MPFLALLNNPELARTQPLIHQLYLGGGFADERTFLLFCGLTAIFFLIAANAFVYFRNALMARFSADQMPRLATRILRAYLAKDYPFFQDRHSGQLAKDILVQSDTVANAILQSWITAISECTTIFTLTALILWADFRVGVVLLASMGSIVSASYFVIRRRIAVLGQQNDEANGRRFEHCLEILGAVKEIKSAEAESHFASSFGPYTIAHSAAYRQSLVLQALPSSLIQALAACFILAVAVWQLALGIEPSRVVVLLSLYAVAGYRLLPSLLKFSGGISQLRQHRALFENIVELLSDAPPQRGDDDAAPLPFEREIRLEAVVFRYPNQALPVFDGLNLTIRAREFVALAGGSGAGKSTLADILLGLQTPLSGALFVDGKRLDPDGLARWRRTVAFVPQSVFLFDSTVAENIAFGVVPQMIDHARIRSAAAMAQISDHIESLPEGYETRIGERGGRLSGGQRQRLGIARALYRQPSVLILDEPTSALDGITEAELSRALEGLKGRLTLIVIAHRPSTVKLGDTVVVLERGRISDSGTYAELISRNRHFSLLMAETSTHH